MMNYICITCGVQYGESHVEPTQCKICSEERQYVNPNGQSWTTLDTMIKNGQYHNELIHKEENLISIATKPKFGIGQAAYFIKNEGCNILWDCITYLDDKTILELKEMGGVQAIALSHPHYYSTQVEWAETFNAPIYIHEDDREWVTRHSDHIQFWSGNSYELANGLTIHRIGGHYKGGSVLHWESGNDQKGVLLTGDIIQVVADQRWVSFMYSYPNLIPLPAHKVREMADKVNLLTFDRIYNAFQRKVESDAREAVQRSADRYIKALEGTLFTT
ncbi:hypothetical protein WAK64_07140 [Bacillus spongiae]|uniref:Metallo-beta-lactamase domain-containing protein n=1 Tax=Bacillus spongiae TaxID=2683610 RepID=A0ABU8HBZ3_9BACI